MSLMTKIKRYALLRHLRKSKIPLGLWHKTIAKMPLMQRYNSSERMQIRLLAGEILRCKAIVPVQGMRLTDEIRIMIATQAAILIFGFESSDDTFSLDWLRNWNQIIVYPTAFRNGRENLLSTDGFLVSWAGVESGETQYQGGIIIDWQDSQPHPLHAHANQVLMHEMAHKLDMLDGYTNGHPPLHANMNEKAWFEAFEEAFEDLNQQIDRGKVTIINPYAASNPAEFFAVATEYFFEAPKRLHRAYPKVYQQLLLFYRQNPISNS
ncbi:M90 family metallopeptidase [Thiomicrorhabdus lithotrophica]|uniref:Zinc-dependent peptidase n=1 Tax=Thiomicrorhabdus lithotrophica TaxID=2949997 RepID=A0ABY8CC83_9GAMM|nr:M90 family metallopeptidase [Thiomicrorhabdus lithotrophica]WEJ63606.1 zinc-dependent peptidase [Thiomicrorhabdus lithotrophica]